MATLFQLPKAVPVSAGSSYASCKAHFYQAGTTTNITTYTTAALSVAHANPVVADANGVFAPIFIDEGTNTTYKMRLVTSADALIYEIDSIPAIPSQANIGATLWPRTDAERDALVTPTNYYYEPGNVLRYGTNTTPGTTDMTAAIQAAIDVAKNAAAGEGLVFIPKGKYRVTSTLNLTGISLSVAAMLNLRIEGEGKYNTVLLAEIGSGSVLDLSHSSWLTFSNFSIRPVATFTPGQVILCARASGNQSAGDHTFRDVWIEGTCDNATVVLWGSEQNHFYDCLIWSNVDKPALVMAVKISEVGFTPTSSFQTLGTGEGGVGMNTFIGTRLGNETGTVQTGPLMKLYGTLGTAFYNCFFSCWPGASGSTIDINGSTYPSDVNNLYPAIVTFDTCSDENAWGNQTTQRTLYFGATTVSGMTNIRGVQVRNCQFFQLYGADGSHVDGLHYAGGKYSNSVASPTGAKASFYNLKSSFIVVSDTEKALSWTVRNIGGANYFRGIDSGAVATGTDTTSVISYSNGDLSNSGYMLSKSSTGGIGYSAGAGGAVTQITSASTAVTLNKVTGQITTVALTTAAGAEEVFQVNNTSVTSLDVVSVSTTYAGAGTPAVTVKGVATNGFVIVITNLHSADALNAALVINFAVIKGITS